MNEYHNIYSKRLQISKNTIVYNYITLLLHVSAYNGRFYGGNYQRKE